MVKLNTCFLFAAKVKPLHYLIVTQSLPNHHRNVTIMLCPIQPPDSFVYNRWMTWQKMCILKEKRGESILLHIKELLIPLILWYNRAERDIFATN